MDAGYSLDKGSYDRRQITEEDFWNVIKKIFSTVSHHDTSYKYGFFMVIMKECLNHMNPDYTLAFDVIFEVFSRIYWNLVAIYGLMQKKVTANGKAAAIDRIIFEVKFNQGYFEQQCYDDLPIDVKVKMQSTIKKKCARYVIGAFYENTDHLMYDFSKKEEYIRFNPQIIHFLQKYQFVLEKIDLYEWAKFLERVNTDSSTIQIIDKLEKSIYTSP